MAHNECAGWPVSYAPDDPVYALYEYEMPVRGTGIVFYAVMNGTLGPIGPVFSARLMRAAALRAATSLIHMGLASGPTFAFLREAVPMTQAEAATFLSTTDTIINEWETGVTPLPRDAWLTLAEKIVQLDNSWMNTYLALTPDLRARRIRIEVDYSS